MSADKSWIHLPNRLSDEYWNGAVAFVQRAKNFVDGRGLVRCPCKKCVNLLFQTLGTLEAHIIDNGFHPLYINWVHHGEADVSTSRRTGGSSPNNRDEMVDIIQDFINPDAPEGIVEGEIEGNEDVFDGGIGLNYDSGDSLFEQAGTELYPGCTSFSALNFLVKLMHLKVLHKWTNKSFDALLKLLKEALPKDNKLPESYYGARKWLNKLGLGYESIHVCKHDCVLFWGEHVRENNCPICGESRWEDRRTKGKKVPQKVLRYFPLTPRLKRLYGSRHTARNMIWHHTGKSTEEGVMRHPVDGQAWQDFDKRYPNFSADPRNVRLGLSADGFNPFSDRNLSYSVWPVVMTTYNLPPWVCMNQAFSMLTLLIPGPHSPGKDLDVFLQPVIQELSYLWDKGVETRDANTNSTFNMRAALLWTVNDFPARSSLSGWSGQGYKACPTCNVDTPSVRVRGKIAYVGHRRWLPRSHTWRNRKEFNGKPERRAPPRPLTNEIILHQLGKVPPKLPGKHAQFGGKKRKRGTDELNWSKRSIFFNLPYWPTMNLRHNIDVMHVEKNVCDSILGTLLDIEHKTKDTDNARRDLADLKIRPELHLYEERGQLFKPHAAYTLSPEERRRFCQYIKNVKFPDGFAGSLRKNVTDRDMKLKGLKSHDCHVILQRLLGPAVRAFLPKELSHPITELCNFFNQICARTINKKDILQAKQDIVIILCKLERIYPPAFFDVMVHLVMHLPDEALQGGPVHFRWMYPYERYIKRLKDYVRNRARPEGSIAEGYIVDEALTFMSMYLEGVETRFNRPDRNKDVTPGQVRRVLSVFRSQCQPLGKKIITHLDRSDRDVATWYILNNCTEIEKYLQ